MRTSMGTLLAVLCLLPSTASAQATNQAGSFLTAASAPGQSSDHSVQNPVPAPTIVSPIQGLKANQLHDSFQEIHNGHPHEAIDISEPAGTPVRAVTSGTI